MCATTSTSCRASCAAAQSTFFSAICKKSFDERSRDLTTFRTPIGLYHLSRLPVRAAKVVAVLQRIITTILYDKIPDVCRPFIDNIEIMGSSCDFADKRLPGNSVCRRRQR